MNTPTGRFVHRRFERSVIAETFAIAFVFLTLANTLAAMVLH